MESAKIVNKILLSSLAFGVVTLGVGMLVQQDNLKKALMTTGAVGSMTCVAGALFTNGKRSSEDSQVDNLLENRVQELRSQEIQLQQSFNEATAKMQQVEADINSLQTEHNQLLSVISDLNSQKQQLDIHSTKEEKLDKFEEDSELAVEKLVSSLDESDLEVFNNEQLSTESENKNELELISSKEGIDINDNFKLYSESNSFEENSETEVNPFISSFDTLEPNKFEEDSELQIEQLVGSLDESDLEAFDEQSSIDVETSSELSAATPWEIADAKEDEFSLELESESESESPDVETSSELSAATPWESADAKEDEFSLELESEAELTLESGDLMGDFDYSNELEEDSIAQTGNSIDNFGQISEGILTTEGELDEFSSLELVEKKLDMLNQISDESLEELKDLLDFVQENDSLMEENQKLDEIIQAKEKQ